VRHLGRLKGQYERCSRAAQYGLGLLIIMALVFAAATLATYIVLPVYSAKRLKRLEQFRFGKFERHGKIVSGMLIAVVGVVFWFWPVA
jgi:hypothetical protein